MGKVRYYDYQTILLVFEKRQYNATRGCDIALPTLALLLRVSIGGILALYVLQHKFTPLPSLPKSPAPNSLFSFISTSPPSYVPSPFQVFALADLHAPSA